jgi:flagellar biogenesis protein FliO
MDTAIIPNIYSLMGSFLVVIVLLLGALFFLIKVYWFKPNKKLNDRQINIIEVLPLNQRQKIILCNVNDQEILLAVSGQSITSLAHWVTKNSKSNDKTIVPKKNLVEKTKIKDEISEITNSKNIRARNSQANNNSDSYTAQDLEKKETDIQTKAKAQIENTNNLLLLAKKINQSINKNIVENIQ